MSKLQNMRGIEMQKFRAVSSGRKTLHALFAKGGFATWAKENRHLFLEHIYEPTDFLWHEDDEITWDSGDNTYILAIKDTVTERDVLPYEIVEFPGGMFLLATADENDGDDLEETVSCMMTWIKDSDVFEYGDFPKSGMCNMPNADGAFDRAMGIAQQQIYLPLKFASR